MRLKALIASASSFKNGSLEELKEYAQRLVASLPAPRLNGNEEKVEVQSLSDEANGDHVHYHHLVDPERLMQLEEMRKKETEAEGGLTGCREAVEILTRNHKKGRLSVLVG